MGTPPIFTSWNARQWQSATNYLTNNMNSLSSLPRLKSGQYRAKQLYWLKNHLQKFLPRVFTHPSHRRPTNENLHILHQRNPSGNAIWHSKKMPLLPGEASQTRTRNLHIQVFRQNLQLDWRKPRKTMPEESRGQSIKLVIIYECGTRETSTHAFESQALKQLSHSGKFGDVKTYEIQITH